MLLAGGQGSRLYTLTEKTAKPAVPFGGKYRIIDFTLSNCVHSGIDTVGVLTQYQPLVLNEYIGNGQPWDLDSNNGGVMILPPYQGTKGGDWYSGTANAIYQNLNFIKRYSPDYTLVLSGDHIYKMDYSEMIRYHKKNGADCTIAVIDVPIEEASRFGILNVDENNKIYEFEEKPKRPKSTKASMGIYVFNTSKMSKYLTADNKDEKSSNDFGKNIIPTMLDSGEKLYAYEFKGYWKDVGTIQSLWEANMDLLGSKPLLDLFDSQHKIFSRSEARPPQYLGADCRVKNSLVTEGCEIYGDVENCILFGGVKIEKGAVVRDSVIMDEVVVSENAQVNYSIVDHDTLIGPGSKIGTARENAESVTVIGTGLKIPEKTYIPTGMYNSSALKAFLKGAE